MLGIDLLTASQIAEKFSEPPQRVTYIIRKHRIKPVTRIGIIRLFAAEQINLIKQYLYDMQTRR